MTDRERANHWQETALLLADQIARLVKLMRAVTPPAVLKDCELNHLLAEVETTGTVLRNSPLFSEENDT